MMAPCTLFPPTWSVSHMFPSEKPHWSRFCHMTWLYLITGSSSWRWYPAHYLHRPEVPVTCSNRRNLIGPDSVTWPCNIWLQVVAADDGTLHIISTDLKCRSHVPIGETSLVQILSHDLVPQSQGLELLVATNDGTLLCLGTGEELADDIDLHEETRMKQTALLALTSDTKSVNDFSYDVNKVCSLKVVNF